MIRGEGGGGGVTRVVGSGGERQDCWEVDHAASSLPEKLGPPGGAVQVPFSWFSGQRLRHKQVMAPAPEGPGPVGRSRWAPSRPM